MKKKFIFAVLVSASFIFNGCKNTDTEIKINDLSIGKIKDQSIEVYVIDSCEYIGIVGSGSRDILTHKGNCKFCEYRRDKK